jgi:ABC-type transporter Mla subunit MlaD
MGIEDKFNQASEAVSSAVDKAKESLANNSQAINGAVDNLRVHARKPAAHGLMA